MTEGPSAGSAAEATGCLVLPFQRPALGRDVRSNRAITPLQGVSCLEETDQNSLLGQILLFQFKERDLRLKVELSPGLRFPGMVGKLGLKPIGVQPTARGPHAALDGYKCSPTQNRKFT